MSFCRSTAPSIFMLAMAWAMGWSAPVSAQTVLRVSASSSWNMPFADVMGDRLDTGILHDLYEAVAKKAGLTWIAVVLPRKRLDGAVVNGDVDLRCHFNPRWTKTPDLYFWSKPLFAHSDVLFGHERTPAARDLSMLPRGSRVSAVLGYAYPALEPAFAAGNLVREDAVDEEKVMLKMTAGRTAYGIVNSAALDWYHRKTP